MSHDNEPSSTVQNLIDDLCEELKALPTPTLDDVAERVGRAPTGDQCLALENLLETWFAHPGADGPVSDEVAVARYLSVAEAIVLEAAAAAAAAARAGAAPAPVSKIDRNRYTFVKPIGRGGFGRVGLFNDTTTRRDVAIKLPREMDNTVLDDKVLDEVRSTCAIGSSRVITILDVGYFWDDNDFYCEDCHHTPAERPAILMEYAAGGPLSKQLNERWHINNIRKQFPQIAMGVGDIHDNDVVHLDLKPANILYGSDGMPRISDLGLAQAWLDASPQYLGGSRQWMSPEHLRAFEANKQITPQPSMDIWSLGVILFQMLTGQHPFDKQFDANWMLHIKTAAVPKVGDKHRSVDSRWDEFFKVCLNGEPDRRYRKIRDLLDGFEEILEAVSEQPRKPAVGGGQGAGLPPLDNGRPPGGNDDESSKDPQPQWTPDERLAGRADVGASELYVDRGSETLQIIAALEGSTPDDQHNAVAYVRGMPGVGKSYAVEYVVSTYWKQQYGSSAHVEVLTLRTQSDLPLPDGDELLTELCGRLNIAATGAEAATRASELLRQDGQLLWIENLDSEEAVISVAALLRKLGGIAVVLTGRISGSGPKQQWIEIPLQPYPEDSELALKQLRLELGDQATDFDTTDLNRLATRLGGLPLALHLAAGHLLQGMSIDEFLAVLKDNLKLGLADATDPRLQDDESRQRVILESTVRISWDRFLQVEAADVSRYRAALIALAFGPAAGVGNSLAAAITELDELSEWPQVRQRAEVYSLLDRVPKEERSDVAVRLHPLVAEVLRRDGTQESAQQVRVLWTAYFVACIVNRRKAAVRAKNERRQELEAVIRRTAKRIQADERVSNPARKDAGLPVHKTSRKPVPAPTTAPFGSVMLTNRLEQSLSFSDSENKRKRPAGAIGVEIYMTIGDAMAPVEPADYSFVELCSRGPKLMTFKAEHANKVAHYLLRWVNHKGETGPWSAPVSGTIPAV